SGGWHPGCRALLPLSDGRELHGLRARRTPLPTPRRPAPHLGTGELFRGRQQVLLAIAPLGLRRAAARDRGRVRSNLRRAECQEAGPLACAPIQGTRGLGFTRHGNAGSRESWTRMTFLG